MAMLKLAGKNKGSDRENNLKETTAVSENISRKFLAVITTKKVRI
jgi:hypothetical protein